MDNIKILKRELLVCVVHKDTQGIKTKGCEMGKGS